MRVQGCAKPLPGLLRGLDPRHGTAAERSLSSPHPLPLQAFEKLPSSYRCPVCSAPKRRFKAYDGAGRNDSKSMNARWEAMQGGGGAKAGGGGSINGGAAAAVAVAAAAGLVGLYFFLSSQYN